MPNPLLSCRIKIDRAYKHLTDFELAFEDFARRNPNGIITDEHSEPGIKIDRVNLPEGIPFTFSALIGDIAHNAISALDSLATALVIRGIGRENVTEEINA
jgi:hypothetical protein